MLMTNEQREKYYKKAEEKLKVINEKLLEQNIDLNLKVDRKIFTTIREEKVKIHLEKIDRRGNERKWAKAKDICKELQSKKEKRNTMMCKPLYIYGYMILDIEEKGESE